MKSKMDVPGVNQPTTCPAAFHTLGKHRGVSRGVEDDEGCSEASPEENRRRVSFEASKVKRRERAKEGGGRREEHARKCERGESNRGRERGEKKK